jgi:hypothetical protein
MKIYIWACFIALTLSACSSEPSKNELNSEVAPHNEILTDGSHISPNPQDQTTERQNANIYTSKFDDKPSSADLGAASSGMGR